MTVVAKTPQEIAACTASQSARGAHSCNKVIPFYPLRYSVAPAEKGGFAYSHPNLEKGFPALEGYQYVLRSLRDDDGFLYIFDQDNREQIICFVYRSPDGDTNGGERRPAQFQRLQLDEKFNAIELVGSPLPFAYIPAYDHDPRQVVVWFADVLQSPTKLSEFKGDVNGIRTKLGTTIHLKPWLQAFAGGKVPDTAPAVNHTLRLEDMAGQQGVGLDGKEVIWSEYKFGARLPSDAALKMAQGPGSARVVMVLHDPVGLVSELNHSIDAVLTQWHGYNKDAARLRWVSETIEALGSNLARETELEAFSIDAVGSALPPGVRGGAADLARDRAYKEGLAAKQRLFRNNLDEKGRKEFLEKDAPTVAHYQQQLDAAARNLLPWGAAYKGPGALMFTVSDLYDWTDARNFVAGRGAFVRTLYGLICSEAGTQELANQLALDGPRDGTLFALALKGYPKASDWSATRQVVETTTDQLATKALKELNAIVNDIRPDAASRQLTAMTLLVLMKGKSQVTPNALWSTRYVTLFEVADGFVARPEHVATKEVPSRLRREAGLKGKVNFRLSPLAQGTRDHITVMRLSAALDQADQAQLRELVPKLSPRVSLWHGAKLGLGGLGVLSSFTNTATALSQFGQADQTALVNSLNVTGSLLGIGSAQRGMLSAVLTRQRDLALLAGRAAHVEVLAGRADVADRWAIGLATLASLTVALKDSSQLGKQGPNEKEISKIGIALQMTSAVAGFSYIGAKLWTLRPTGLAGKIALQSIGRAVAFNVAERTALWVVDAPVALVIAALQLAYTWNQVRADKAKVADWIKQSCLGLAPMHSSAEEQRKYYELFLKPRVDTSLKLGNIALESVFPGSRGTRAQRDVVVLLPGWQPQISAYQVTQNVVFGLMTESAFDDPEKVEVKDGSGYLRLEAHNLFGNTAVRYWPNGFTQPDLMLEMTN